ncbi:hypothetical protein HOE22_00355, partial [Candidatus Woesearchaeota archaeon]|nr:hypothetical protein [Candidatus Woesearchaeota archaeon]
MSRNQLKEKKMALENLISEGIVTEAGIGNKGELCCDKCIDENGMDSTSGGKDTPRCGDARDDGENLTYMEVEILIACDSCECEVSQNRQNHHGAWYHENNT